MDIAVRRMFVGLLNIPNYYNLNKYPDHSRGNPCGCPKITGTHKGYPYKKISRKHLQKIYIKQKSRAKRMFFGNMRKENDKNGIMKSNDDQNKIRIYFDEVFLDAIIYKDIYMG